MPPLIVICVSGYAQSGKDTLAQAIIRHTKVPEGQIKVYKFAQSLRSALRAGLNEMGVHTDVWTEEPAAKEALRPLMVEFGRYCRAQDEDCFAKRTAQSIIDDHINGLRVALITDLRYENEWNIIHSTFSPNGKAIRLDIDRVGTFARNAEEKESIRILRDRSKDHHEVYSFTADDGDLEAIDCFAAEVATKVNWVYDLAR